MLPPSSTLEVNIRRHLERIEKPVVTHHDHELVLAALILIPDVTRNSHQCQKGHEFIGSDYGRLERT